MNHWKQMWYWIEKKEPALIIWIIVSCLVTGITPVFGIIMPKIMLDELLGEKNERKLMGMVVVLALGTLVCALGKALCKKKTSNLMEQFTMKMEEEMGKKPIHIPLSVSEKKSSMDLYERGKYGLHALEDWNVSIQKIGGGTVTCISSGVIILSNQWYLLFLLLAVNVFMIPFMKKMKDLEVDNANRSVPENREFQYYCSIACDFRYTKDLKMSGGISFMMKRAEDNMNRILKMNHVYFTKVGYCQGAIAAVTELETAILFVILGILLYAGGISVGMFTMLYNACRQFGQTWNGMMTAGNQMITDGILLQPLMEYLNMEEEEEETKVTEEVKVCMDQAHKGILEWEFRDVTFSYPGSEKTSLNHCDFQIHTGETIALVGKNGAGKSTIVKLLCRFYEPQMGQILLNGVDIRSIPRKEYRMIISPTFQDFQLLPFSIEENILCKCQKEITKEEKERMEGKARHLDFFRWADALPEKFSTYLSKNLTENGVLPSGGLAQKIALARSVCHNGGMMIMDEPTAALDPRSEEDIFTQMGEIARNRTSLFISHRLSSTRLADRILVMENGKIAESGSHDYLMEKEGIYWELYEVQASAYDLLSARQ